ncbi:hypothetical protein HK097_009689 [Rhizophlyctis rosea]|uniref:Uncharacterized protein n=1 Tax=Rhizophlyctis rosea TaxID=64517 RepID=A0AAD5X093_9FUNG|nr:hypothetical protein HK097_009689 [Rhizophlyctis rosea]
MFLLNGVDGFPDADIQSILSSSTATELSKKYKSATSVLKCVDHPLTANSSAILQFVPTSPIPFLPPQKVDDAHGFSVRFPGADHVIAIQIQSILNPDTKDVSAIPSTGHSIVRNILTDFDLDNTPSVFGPDCIIEAQHPTFNLQNLFISETLLDDTNQPYHQRQTVSVYPTKPWNILMRLLRTNNLELLADHLDNLESTKSLNKYKWLWEGGPARYNFERQIIEFMKGHADKVNFEFWYHPKVNSKSSTTHIFPLYRHPA